MNGVKSIIKIILAIAIVSIAGIVLLGLATHTRVLNTVVTSKKNTFTNCEIVFMHGYNKTNRCKFFYPEIAGGKLGGHVELKLDSNYYGFNKTTKEVSLLPKRIKKSIFEKHNQIEWDSIRGFSTHTKVTIPLSEKQYKSIKKELSKHVKSTSFDYAFLGYRCTSYLVQILSDSGVINPISETSCITAYFYPEILRTEMIKYAKKNNLRFELVKGDQCLDWEY